MLSRGRESNLGRWINQGGSLQPSLAIGLIKVVVQLWGNTLHTDLHIYISNKQNKNITMNTMNLNTTSVIMR